MAKTRSAGPGTRVQRGVHTTMDAPFTKAQVGGHQNMSGTFDQARSGGDNGLPTRIYDSAGGPKPGGTGQAIKTSSPGTILTDPKKR